MKKRIIHIGKLILIYGLITLLFSTVLNSTFNIHSHILKDGTIVVHSHKYDKTGDKAASHNHSNSEIVLFDLIKVLFFNIAIIHIALFSIRNFEFEEFLRKLKLSPVIYQFHQRGPPAFILS